MREQLLWAYGPRTQFVGKHPYADILGARPSLPNAKPEKISDRYRATTLKAIGDNPGIQTSRLSRLLRTIEPRMARSTVQNTLTALEKSGAVRSEPDVGLAHGPGKYRLWYLA